MERGGAKAFQEQKEEKASAKPAQLHVRTDGNLDTSFAQNVQGGLGDKARTEHEHLTVERRNSHQISPSPSECA